MKIREGFVSNSSSSSFVINLSVITNIELDKIMNYMNDPEQNVDGWWVQRDDDNQLLKGFTSMDNGHFSEWSAANGFNKVLFYPDGY